MNLSHSSNSGSVDPAFINFGPHRLAYLAHPNPTATHLPVILIHGLTASVRFWEAAMPEEFRRRHAWYSLSLPLHHPSTYEGEYNDQTLTESVFAEMLHEQICRVVPQGRFLLVGYSVGGFAALNYAAKYPDRVAGVISAGGFTSGRAKGLEGVLQLFAKGRIIRRAIFWMSWKVLQSHIFFLRKAVKFYSINDRKLLAYPHLETTLRLIFPDVARHDIAGMRVWFRSLLNMELSDERENITCPVLAFAGESDPIIPYNHQVEYASKLPDACLVSLPGVGHVPFAEAPQVFERKMIEFLGRFEL
ncbi:hypothetical protein CEQ90_15395 [Lewinellaceae bacterium SD302]|nr:hypothetical protein CEQ90_15395 [Lewinellaceae bacterium SD302]